GNLLEFRSLIMVLEKTNVIADRHALVEPTDARKAKVVAFLSPIMLHIHLTYGFITSICLARTLVSLPKVNLNLGEMYVDDLLLASNKEVLCILQRGSVHDQNA
ncbi:hypothetical protein Tco_1478691, partial [Tanacetum coccineum]